MRYLEFWTSVIWPTIKDDFECLLEKKPRRQEDHATGSYYGGKMYGVLADAKEVRHVTCNLCWTSPSENTSLQADISLALVENFAMGVFCVVVPRNDKMAAPVLERCVEDCEVEARDNEVKKRKSVAKAVEATRRDTMMAEKRVFNLPERVPKYFSTPIGITPATTERRKANSNDWEWIV